MADPNKLSNIASQAEKDVNTYSSKTGAARKTGLDEDAGVNTASEQKFPGSKVVYGEGLTQEAYGTTKPHKKQPTTTEQIGGRQAAAPPTTTVARDIATQGKLAEVRNVGKNPPGVGGSQFKGENYYVPEDVPDSTAALGKVPPDSVTQASRESEGYGRK